MCWRKIFVFIFRLLLWIEEGRKDAWKNNIDTYDICGIRQYMNTGHTHAQGVNWCWACSVVQWTWWSEARTLCTVYCTYCTVLHCTGGPVTAHASYLCAGCLALPVLAGAVSRLGAVNTGHICAGRRSCWAAELGDWVICVSMRVVVARVRSHSSDQTVMHCCAMHRCVMHHSCRPLLHRTTLLQGDEELPIHITESSGEA